ncbi:N-acetylmuramoyl-L-alanine amidase [Desulfurivibrio sp. D14AmB]|uniref:N-acetylmuramoyl-L-alanine amidase n=1 Tax=Desulfurivibrio sp. D14AmB TaxID=3374370 RepID=UPI00376EF920
MMKIADHRLAAEFAGHDWVDKSGGKFAPGLPDTVVIHYTGGGSLASALNTFKDPQVSASAHVLVDKDGRLVQLVPFNRIAWHAGTSSYLDRRGLNSYSIGIEVVNAGKLERSGGLYRSWFGRSYPEEEVVRAVHRNEEEPAYWERFTQEQIAAVLSLCQALKSSYQICHILGHEEISPGRKIDPGPAFPLDKLRDRLLHDNRKDEPEAGGEARASGIVRAQALNVRSGPSVNSPTIVQPLSRNTELQILDEQKGWYQVEVKVRGWVAGEFVEKLSSS